MRCGSSLRVLVAYSVSNTATAGPDSSSAPPASISVCLPLLDHLVRVADRLAARRARARRRHDAALQVPEQADVDGRGVRHHLHVAVRGDVAHRTGFDHLAERTDRSTPTRRRTIGHAHAAVLDGGVVEQARIGERQFAGAHD